MSVSVWLLGCSGMLGTEVRGLLCGRGIRFFASDKEVDITDERALKRFAENRSFDWIVNCAAYTAVDRAEDESEAAFRINAWGVRNVAALAREREARLLHVSTDYVFNGLKNGEYLEDDTPNPLGVYGRSKMAGEIGVRETVERHFIVRTAWLYGRHGVNFVSTMLRLFGERERVKVVNDQRGTPTYARDLARAIVTIVEADNYHFGTYHYTNEGSTTWYEFARRIYTSAKECGLVRKTVEILPIGSSEYPSKAKRPANSLLSKEKIKTTFGIRNRRWEEALEEFLRSLREPA